MVPPAKQSDVKQEEDYKKKYLALKSKLKFLIFENEAFTEEINRTEQLILQVLKDKNYLLDQLLQYEDPESDTSSLDGEATESSDGETKQKPRMDKLKRYVNFLSLKLVILNSKTNKPGTPGVKRLGVSNAAPKPKKKVVRSPKSQETLSQGHMTPEEVEKHLESRKLILDFAFDRAPPTVPAEMFSNELSSLERYTVRLKSCCHNFIQTHNFSVNGDA
nr:EOG090X0LZH [Triops cancriformis]